MKKIEEETHECEFDVKVPLAPVVELGEYKGLPVEKPSLDVSEEDVIQMDRRLSAGDVSLDAPVASTQATLTMYFIGRTPCLVVVYQVSAPLRAAPGLDS